MVLDWRASSEPLVWFSPRAFGQKTCLSLFINHFIASVGNAVCYERRGSLLFIIIINIKAVLPCEILRKFNSSTYLFFVAKHPVFDHCAVKNYFNYLISIYLIIICCIISVFSPLPHNHHHCLRLSCINFSWSKVFLQSLVLRSSRIKLILTVLPDLIHV